MGVGGHEFILSNDESGGKVGEDITIPLVQPPTASTGPTMVAQASHGQISSISELSGSKLVSVGSSAMILEPVTNSIVPAIVSLDS